MTGYAIERLTSMRDRLIISRDEARRELGDLAERAASYESEITETDAHIADLDLAISALTPPLQHKGGETEAGAFDDGEAMRQASTLPPGARYKTDEEIRASFRRSPPTNQTMPDGFIAWPPAEGFVFPDGTTLEFWWSDGKRFVAAADKDWTEPADAYRIISSSEVDCGPRSSLAQGDARVEQTISTLQASSGEGETLPSMDDIIDPDFTGGLLTEEYLERLHKGTLGAVDEFLSSIMERGGTWHDGGNNPAPNWFVDIYVPAASTNLGDKPQHLKGQPSNAYIWGGWECAYVRTKPMQLDGPLTSALRLDEPAESPTEPAAYSPVNNADEPVTKPEADFFAQALIPVQPGIEFSVDGGPKQATGAAKLFGGIFAKKVGA